MYICKYRSTHHLSNERESSTRKNDFPQTTTHMLNLGISKQTFTNILLFNRYYTNM